MVYSLQNRLKKAEEQAKHKRKLEDNKMDQIKREAAARRRAMKQRQLKQEKEEQRRRSEALLAKKKRNDYVTHRVRRTFKGASTPRNRRASEYQPATERRNLRFTGTSTNVFAVNDVPLPPESVISAERYEPALSAPTAAHHMSPASTRHSVRSRPISRLSNFTRFKRDEDTFSLMSDPEFTEIAKKSDKKSETEEDPRRTLLFESESVIDIQPSDSQPQIGKETMEFAELEKRIQAEQAEKEAAEERKRRIEKRKKRPISTVTKKELSQIAEQERRLEQSLDVIDDKLGLNPDSKVYNKEKYSYPMKKPILRRRPSIPQLVSARKRLEQKKDSHIDRRRRPASGAKRVQSAKVISTVSPPQRPVSTLSVFAEKHQEEEVFTHVSPVQAVGNSPSFHKTGASNRLPPSHPTHSSRAHIPPQLPKTQEPQKPTVTAGLVGGLHQTARKRRKRLPLYLSESTVAWLKDLRFRVSKDPAKNHTLMKDGFIIGAIIKKRIPQLVGNTTFFPGGKNSRHNWRILTSIFKTLSFELSKDEIKGVIEGERPDIIIEILQNLEDLVKSL
ncbi:hypothetical protein PCE1_003558 [Barthelona sp. PCE]